MRYLKNNYKMIYFNQRKIMNENEMMQILSNDYKVKLKKYIAKNIKYSIIINEKLIKQSAKFHMRMGNQRLPKKSGMFVSYLIFCYFLNKSIIAFSSFKILKAYLRVITIICKALKNFFELFLLLFRLLSIILTSFHMRMT